MFTTFDRDLNIFTNISEKELITRIGHEYLTENEEELSENEEELSEKEILEKLRNNFSDYERETIVFKHIDNRLEPVNIDDLLVKIAAYGYKYGTKFYL